MSQLEGSVSVPKNVTTRTLCPTKATVSILFLLWKAGMSIESASHKMLDC